MTRKDYQRIARALRTLRDPTNATLQGVVDVVAASIARELEADNPRFSKQRFIEATR